MNNLLKIIKDIFDMSLTEAKTVLVLFLIIFFSIIFYFWFDNYTTTIENGIVVQKLDENLKLEFPKTQKKEWKQFDHYKETNDYRAGNSNVSNIKFHNFNPNLCSESDLLGLGFPKFIAQRILNYRNKGGRFLIKDDLKKIYGVRPESVDKLKPFIQLPDALNANSSQNISDKPNSFEKSKIASKPLVKTFDLNKVDTSTLISVKGIGRVFANRIIKYRDLLGGFHSIEQVSETYGINPEIIDELRKVSTVSKQSIKKIDINSVKVEDFRHAYVKKFIAKSIIAYREQHGRFNSIIDLKNVKTVDETLLLKIEPYLEFK